MPRVQRVYDAWLRLRLVPRPARPTYVRIERPARRVDNSTGEALTPMVGMAQVRVYLRLRREGRATGPAVVARTGRRLEKGDRGVFAGTHGLIPAYVSDNRI